MSPAQGSREDRIRRSKREKYRHDPIRSDGLYRRSERPAGQIATDRNGSDCLYQLFRDGGCRLLRGAAGRFHYTALGPFRDHISSLLAKADFPMARPFRFGDGGGPHRTLRYYRIH